MPTFSKNVRGSAIDRRTSRTSKTIRGVRCRTILVSVLESPRLHVDDFTLSGVLQEATTWTAKRPGLFGRLLNTTGLAPPRSSPLATLFPLPAK